MRWENVHVAGSGAWLGVPELARSAVEDGRYDAEQATQDDFLSVSVADEAMAPPDMAIHAATAAFKRSGLDVAEVGMLIHSGIWFQGADMWPVASYVANHVLGLHIPSFVIGQECNAGLASLELAALHVQSMPGIDAVMLTTSDRFGTPMIQRWGMEPGVPYGDGAGALLLSRSGGFAKLLSTASVADNSLEAMLRGSQLSPLPPSNTEPLDLFGRLKHHFTVGGGDLRKTAEAVGARMREVVDRAVSDAGIEVKDVNRVVAMTSGRARTEHQITQLLGLPAERSTFAFARRVGHLGAGDHFVALNHMVEQRELNVGDRVLFLGGGTGFSATCAVLEITARPQWEPTPYGEA